MKNEKDRSNVDEESSSSELFAVAFAQASLLIVKNGKYYTGSRNQSSHVSR